MTTSDMTSIVTDPAALIEFHRKTFGDARMDAEGGDKSSESKDDEAPKDESGKDESDDGKDGQEDKDEDSVPPHVLRRELTDARAEAANYRVKLREAEKRLSEAKTVDEYESAVGDLRTQLASMERKVLVSDVARRFELPDALAARLQGESKEELEADAKALAQFASAKVPGHLSGGLDPSDEDDTGTDPTEYQKRYPRR